MKSFTGPDIDPNKPSKFLPKQLPTSRLHRTSPIQILHHYLPNEVVLTMKNRSILFGPLFPPLDNSNSIFFLSIRTVHERIDDESLGIYNPRICAILMPY